MARGRSEVTEHLLLSNGATQVSRTAPAERRNTKKCYQETIDTDVNARYVPKVDQTELNKTKNKLQWYLPHRPFINQHKPE